MPVYLFVAQSAVPPGGIDRFVITHPGDVSQAIAYAKAQGYGQQQQQVRFKVYGVPPGYAEPQLLAAQYSLGVPVNGQQPQLSPAHVQGGQPTGVPHAMPGQSRPQGPRDERSYFQPLADADLPSEADSMYGSGDHGTVDDVVIGEGGIPYTIPRQQ